MYIYIYIYVYEHMHTSLSLSIYIYIYIYIYGAGRPTGFEIRGPAFIIVCTSHHVFDCSILVYTSVGLYITLSRKFKIAPSGHAIRGAGVIIPGISREPLTQISVTYEQVREKGRWVHRSITKNRHHLLYVPRGGC